MYRPLFLGFTLILAVTKVNAQSFLESDLNITENNKREIRSIALAEEIIQSVISNGLGSLRPIISLIRTQVREIVVDLAFQLIKFLRSVLHDYKIRMFKRLGTYTLSDVFHFLFDGIFEFVGGYENELNPEDGSPALSSTEQNNGFPDPTLVDRLIQSGDN